MTDTIKGAAIFVAIFISPLMAGSVLALLG